MHIAELDSKVKQKTLSQIISMEQSGVPHNDDYIFIDQTEGLHHELETAE